jgi:hypothetical protein
METNINKRQFIKEYLYKRMYSDWNWYMENNHGILIIDKVVDEMEDWELDIVVQQIERTMVLTLKLKIIEKNKLKENETRK